MLMSQKCYQLLSVVTSQNVLLYPRFLNKNIPISQRCLSPGKPRDIRDFKLTASLPGKRQILPGGNPMFPKRSSMTQGKGMTFAPDFECKLFC